MSLPTRDDLLTMDFSYMGQPFVQTATKSGIDLNTLDYSYLGQPFWAIASDYVPPDPPPVTAVSRRYFGNLIQRVGTRTVK